VSLACPECQHENREGRRFCAKCGAALADEAWIFRLLGEIASRRDPSDVEQAELSYRQALPLGERLEMRPLVAHCHLGLGRLYRRAGRDEQAQEHLARATLMYREMDMRFWLEQAEADLRTPV
jgi:tetratricopeptide (TPR) repeat protein